MSTITATHGLEMMLNELESNQLQVILVPEKRRTHDMGMVRCVVSRNAEWYRKFCARHPSQRGVRRGKFDTAIRRQHVIKALERMIAGQVSYSPYAEELLQLSKKYAS